MVGLRAAIAASVALTAAGCVRLAASPKDAARQEDVSDTGGGLDSPGRLDSERHPFSSPRPIAVLGDGDDQDPSLTGDLRQLYFVSINRPGGVRYEDIWLSKRASPTAPWSSPVLASELSTTSRDASPSVSRDGRTMVFASNRPGGKNGWDIWIATRQGATDPFGPALPVQELNTENDELPSAITDDRLLLVYHAHREGQTDLFVAARASADVPFSPGVPMAGVGSPTFDSSGDLTSDRLHVVFDSDRPGGAGLRDLYLADRASPKAAFDPPRALAELNTSGNDADPWVTDDLSYLVFARSPATSGLFAGPFTLYEARRP